MYSYESPYLTAALKQGKAFLLSQDIFWNLGIRSPKGQPPYPQLSLANMLLSVTRLKAAIESELLSEKQHNEIETLNSILDELHTSWQSAWQKKAEIEFGLRLREWTRFLEEELKTDSPFSEGNLDRLRTRALLQLLIPYLPESQPSLVTELALLDQRLKQATQPAEFLWPKTLKSRFPAAEYWFLYVKTNEKEN